MAADDLVLQAEQQADEDRGFCRCVIGMARLAEDPRGRADEDETPRTVAELAQEAARGEERGGEVRVERRAPAIEWQLPDRDVLLRPRAGDRSTDVEAAGFREQPVDLRLVREIRAGDRRARQVRRDGFGALAPAVVVEEDLRALGRECTRACRPDSAR